MAQAAMDITSKVRELKRADLLLSAGWYLSDEGWRHPHLNGGRWPWPDGQAVRLTREADKGGADEAHRMLRGET